MRVQFTASGQYSPEFYAGRFGFDIGITFDAGTNSVTVEKEIAGTWYTYGAAITTSGTMRHYAPGVDYYPGQKIRVKWGTFQTGPAYADIDGDVIGAEISQDSPGLGWLLEAGDDWLMETGDYWLLENA